MKALIVDDQKEKAMLIAEWLKPFGVDATLCLGYESAVECSSSYFNLVIVDYFLGCGSFTGDQFLKMYCEKFSPQHRILYTANLDTLPFKSSAIEFDNVKDLLATILQKKNSEPKTEIITIRESLSEIKEWKRLHEDDDQRFRDEVTKKFEKIDSFIKKADHFIDNSKYVVGVIILAYLVLPNEGLLKLAKVFLSYIWR